MRFEEISVSTPSVSCDGGGGALGHPKVYLQIEQEKGRIQCPYCSRNYVLSQSPNRASHH